MFLSANIDLCGNYSALDVLNWHEICYENSQYDQHSIHHKNFIFLKHGETDWTKELLHLGPMDLPLNTAGFVQAEGAGNLIGKFDVSMIISSPSSRCIQTAETIAKSLKNPIMLVASDIEERYFGDWSKQAEATREIVQNSTNGTGFFRSIEQKVEELLPTDAEKQDVFYTRIISATNKYLSLYNEENLLIVAHGCVMNALAKSMNISSSEVNI